MRREVRLGRRERLRTIFATAVLTSAAWIAAGLVLYSRQPVPDAGERQLLSAREEPVPTELSDGRLVVPVQGVRREQLEDTWGQSREGGRRAHEGIDIMAPRGTPVVAAAAGTVEKLFVSERGGNTVYVRSLDGRTIHYYAHLAAYAPRLSAGQQVRAGQHIGYVGSTGSASPEGPHLHFAVNLVQPGERWWEGTPINPFPLLRR